MFRYSGFLIVSLLFMQCNYAIAQNQITNGASGLFIENHGQLADDKNHPLPDVLFYADFPFTKIYITKWGLTYFLYKPLEEELPVSLQQTIYTKNNHVQPAGKFKWERIDVEFADASIDKNQIVTEDISNYNFNFYYPQCSQGIFDVKSSNTILIKNIYPGIDWKIYKQSTPEAKGFKQDFIVHAGADYKQIKLKYSGCADFTSSITNNKLIASSSLGSIDEGGLIGIEENKDVAMSYTQIENNTYQFDINGNHNPNSELIIDPRVLVWGTYYGGSLNELANSIHSDGTNVWQVGGTSSVNFPCLNPGGGAFYQGTNAANYDTYILKFNMAGVQQSATYYGGNDNDVASAVFSDGTNIWITGNTKSTNFPMQTYGGAYNQNTTSGNEIFILRFNPSMTCAWSTYYGGSGMDSATSIYSSGTQVWITGTTTSNNFPVQSLPGAYNQAVFGGVQDAFVLRFSIACVRGWATYFGGNDIDQANTITINGNHVFVAGNTKSDNLPIQNPGGGAYYQTVPDGQEIFIVKFNTSGAKQWCTYYGGNDDENINCAATDGISVWFVGSAVSLNIPKVAASNASAYYQSNFGGADESGLILKFSVTGVRQWATYYGGHVNTICKSVCVRADTVWIIGDTESENFPRLDPGNGAFFQNHNSNLPNIISESWDMFILEFDTAGVRRWATYYGDVEDDFGNSVCMDGIYLWVAGNVTSNTGLTLVNPGGSAYFQNTCGCGTGFGDGVILKFGMPPIPLPVSLLEFNAKLIGDNKARCNWTTANESNCSFFMVEKSLDGNNFTSLGIITGHGTTQQQNNYSFTDAHPDNGINYYRLKQVDFNGDFNYSSIVPVKVGDKIFNCSHFNSNEGIYTIDCFETKVNSAAVYDLQGRLILNLPKINSTSFEIDLSKLNQEIYLLKVVAGNSVYSQKLIKD